MDWKVRIPNKVGKKIKKLPESVQSTVLLLIRDLEQNGPNTGGDWKNYGKFKGVVGDKRHNLTVWNLKVCCYLVLPDVRIDKPCVCLSLIEPRIWSSEYLLV